MANVKVDLSESLQEISDSCQVATAIVEKAIAEGWSPGALKQAVRLLNNHLNGNAEQSNFVTLTPTVNVTDYGTNKDYNVGAIISEIKATLKKEICAAGSGAHEEKDLDSKENTIIIDYGAVNLKSLIITNSLEEYQKRKAQGNTGVLFEPQLMECSKLPNLYAVGILAGDEE
ncbi:MAG: hypothetical protein AAGU16_05605 [Desulfitobacterium hafniense]